MGGCLWKPDDEYAGGVVREIRHGRDMVQRGEDVDCEWTDAIEAGVIAGGVGEWHSLAGREDSVADGGGDGNDSDGGERRGVDEQDDDGSNDDIIRHPLHRTGDPPPHLHGQRRRILYASQQCRDEFAV